MKLYKQLVKLEGKFNLNKILNHRARVVTVIGGLSLMVHLIKYSYKIYK
jgi:hypothetical protein